MWLHGTVMSEAFDRLITAVLSRGSGNLKPEDFEQLIIEPPAVPISEIPQEDSV